VEVPRFGWNWTEVGPRDENPAVSERPHLAEAPQVHHPGRNPLGKLTLALRLTLPGIDRVAAEAVTGKRTVNSLPRPTPADLASIVPKCSSTSLRDTAKPTPKPLASPAPLVNSSENLGEQDRLNTPTIVGDGYDSFRSMGDALVRETRNDARPALKGTLSASQSEGPGS
jgi:hypothetical protein